MKTVELCKMLSPETTFEAKVKIQYDANSGAKYGAYLRWRRELVKELVAEIGEESVARLGHWLFFKRSEDALAFYLKIL